MGQDDFEEQELDELARRLRDEVSRMFRMGPQTKASTTVHGMFAVLHTLVLADGPLSPGDLARRCGITDARIANILRALEDRAYVERRGSATDRRRVEVTITPAGRASHDEQFGMFHERMSAILQELGSHDARELVRIMGKANDIVERRVAESIAKRSSACETGACTEMEEKGVRA